MAIRYVKDFEFPSAAGYTKSATKVTGQMYAKGGEAKKPKGGALMVMIGLGKKPMKKADGGPISDDDRAAMSQMSDDASAASDAERIMSGRSKAPSVRKRPAAPSGSPYIPGTNIPVDQIYSKEDQDRLERGYKKGGKVAKVMHEYGKGELHSGSKKGPKVTNPKQAVAIALSEAGKSKKAKGGKVSEMEWEHSKKDMREDKKLAKKHGMSMEAWEKSDLDKKHDKQQSVKGLKKGGSAHPDGCSCKMCGGIMKKADGGVVSPLQRMALAPKMMRPRSVPVAPSAPMIPSQAPSAPMGSQIGVNRRRPTPADVGAIRAAMAKAASQATPQNTPSVMKKGGKVKY